MKYNKPISNVKAFIQKNNFNLTHVIFSKSLVKFLIIIFPRHNIGFSATPLTWCRNVYTDCTPQLYSTALYIKNVNDEPFCEKTSASFISTWCVENFYPPQVAENGVFQASRGLLLFV